MTLTGELYPKPVYMFNVVIKSDMSLGKRNQKI